MGVRTATISISQDIILTTTVAMASDRWRQIEELYQSALKLAAAERSALLAGADPDLRREVEVLLAGQGDSTVTQIAVGFQLGTYRIEAPIGEGGMGVVYRALDTKLNRPVAVKFLSNELADAAARRRFQREAQLASPLPETQQTPGWCGARRSGPGPRRFVDSRPRTVRASRVGNTRSRHSPPGRAITADG